MKNKFKQIKKRLKDFKYDHPNVRITDDFLRLFIFAAISAFIYSYGYKTFVSPSMDISGTSSTLDNIVTGGASGIAQVITVFFEIGGVNLSTTIGQTTLGYLIQSIFYAAINIPLVLIAFRGVGKRFAIFTIVNVGFYFLFVNIIPNGMCSVFYSLSSTSQLTIFPRAIFAGLCTGISTSIAMKSGHSTGGVDVLSVYITNKNPNKSIGKMSLIINTGIIITYTIASYFSRKNWSFVGMSIYSIVYFFVSGQVVDTFVVRNKKKQLNIVTSHQELPDILIANFPHSATIMNAKGAYSKEDKLLVYMILSDAEVKTALSIIREVDEKAFVTVTNVTALSGRFFIKPNE